MRKLGLVSVMAVLLAGVVAGCAISPAEQEATRRAWAERDGERLRECMQRGGRWVAGGCVWGPGS